MKNKSHHKEFRLQEDESLTLMAPQALNFPSPPSTPKSKYSSFASLLKNSPPQQTVKQILPIPEQLIVILCGNTIFFYEQCALQHNKHNQHSQCSQIEQLELDFKAYVIKTFNSARQPKNKQFYLVAENCCHNRLSLVQFDPVLRSSQQIAVLKTACKVICWSFVAGEEILIWCENMQLYHYELGDHGFKKLTVTDSRVELSKECSNNNQKYQLNYSAILGTKQSKTQQIIALFYILYSEKTNFMKVKCKEILYPPAQQTDLTEVRNHSILNLLASPFYSSSPAHSAISVLPETYEIMSNNFANPQILETLSISKIGDMFLISFRSEIICVQKIFGGYYALDNIYRKSKDCEVLMCSNSNIAACVYGDILEISEFVLRQNKLHSKMIDFLDLRIDEDQEQLSPTSAGNNQLGNIEKALNPHSPKTRKTSIVTFVPSKTHKFPRKLVHFWVSSNPHRSNDQTLRFIFSTELKRDQPLHLLYNTRKVLKIKKITELAKEVQEEAELQSIQKLGQIIGVEEASFFLSLWENSKQTSEDIRNYLLRCKDYSIITREMRNYLRRRNLRAAQLVKLFQDIEVIVKEELSKELTEDHLKAYFEVTFIVRKFKIYSKDYELDEAWFNKTLQASLYDIVYDLIDRELGSTEEEVSPWQPYRKEPPKLDMLQVLHEFKLPLLEYYCTFLSDLLERYSADIVLLIQKYPMLLPNYPFNSPTEYVLMTESVAMIKFNSLALRQKGLFTEILQSHLKHEPSFIQNIIIELERYFTTSSIRKKIESLFCRPEVQNCKFITHMIINREIEQYLDTISQISGDKLYLIVLSRLVKSARNRRQKARIKDLLQIFTNNYNIPEALSYSLYVTSAMYELFLEHSMISPGTTELQDMFSDPIEKWIALFFLGNKQKKSLIFNEFMELFPNPSDFQAALQKYVKSEHCSKIELTILIDLISKEPKSFQIDNQNTIEIIMAGFFGKIEIRDIDGTENFIRRIEEVYLCSQLLYKVSRIKQWEEFLLIFLFFKMEKLLLQALFDDPFYLINEMLEKFFEGQVSGDRIILPVTKYVMDSADEVRQVSSQKIIPVSNCLQMFDLFHYLREKLILDAPCEEILMTYCRKLVEWQRFEQVKFFIYQADSPNYPALYGEKNAQDFVYRLIDSALNDLYFNESLYFDQETIDYINKIMQIDEFPQSNRRITKESAKLELAKIFSSWGNEGYAIKLYNLEAMCVLWAEEFEEVFQQDLKPPIQVRVVMIEIIQDYVEFLDFATLRQIYKCFMTITENLKSPDTCVPEFCFYCEQLACKLLDIGLLEQSSLILLQLAQNFEINYTLVFECMIKTFLSTFQQQMTHSEHKQSLALGALASLEHDSRLYPSFKKAPSTKTAKNPSKKTIEQIIDRNEEWKYTSSLTILKKRPSQPPPQPVRETALTIKRYLDYLVVNRQRKNRITQILKSQFEDSLRDMQESFIHVSSEICFECHNQCKISTDDLWDFVVVAMSYRNISMPDQTSTSQTSISQVQQVVNIQAVAYGYYFMALGLHMPSVGFQNLDDIKYNQTELLKILNKLELYKEASEQFFKVDYSQILKLHLNWLIKNLRLEKKNKITSEIQIEQNRYSNCEMVKSCGENSIVFQNKTSLKRQMNYSVSEYYAKPSDSIIMSGASGYCNEMSTDYELLKSQIKEGFYKDCSLNQVVMKVMELYHRALKSWKFREQKFMKYIGRNKQLQSEVDQVNISRDQAVGDLRTSKKIVAKVIPTPQLERIELKFKDMNQIMKKIQSSYEINTSFTDVVNEDLSERNIFQEIRKHLKKDPRDSCCDRDSILHSLITDSLRELAAEDIQEKDESAISSTNNHPDIFGPLDHSQQTLLKYMTKDNDKGVINWGKQTIYEILTQVYMHEDVSFSTILKTLLHFQIGDRDKLEVLSIAEPENLEMPQEIIKTAFPPNYVVEPFGILEHNMEVICANVESVILRVRKKDLKTLVQYYHQICKIKYRRSNKNQFKNRLATLALVQIAKNEVWDGDCEMEILKWLMIMDKQYGSQNYDYILAECSKYASETLLQSISVGMNVEFKKQQL